MSLAPLERTTFDDPQSDPRTIEILELNFAFSADLSCEWDDRPAHWIWFHGEGDSATSHIVCSPCKEANDESIHWHKVLSLMKDPYCLGCHAFFKTDTYVTRPI